jgi:hypothetical protein
MPWRDQRRHPIVEGRNGGLPDRKSGPDGHRPCGLAAVAEIRFHGVTLLDTVEAAEPDNPVNDFSSDLSGVGGSADDRLVRVKTPVGAPARRAGVSRVNKAGSRSANHRPATRLTLIIVENKATERDLGTMSMANGTVGSTASVAGRVSPHQHAVTIGIVNRAVRRDLDRFVRVLAEPVTSVRRVTLVDHAVFVVNQLEAVHRWQDELLWPAALAHRPHLADLADGAAQAHASLGEPIAVLRLAAQSWKRAPITRIAARTAIRELAAALEPAAGQDAETVPLACAMIPEDAWAQINEAAPRPVGPTKVARRLFWLLDDLPPAQAQLLLAPTPTWMLWVLRNGFSGAYNRAAYLMWLGGGNGPAV